MEYKRVPIMGYEGLYEIDSNGDVFSLKRNRKLALSITGNRYYKVMLSKNGVSKRYYIHRLVAYAFVPNPHSLAFVNHKDENKLNNKASNLEWCTKSYNAMYGTCRERVIKNRAWYKPSEETKRKTSQSLTQFYKEHPHKYRPVKHIESGVVYQNYDEAAVACGVHRETVRRQCEGQIKTQSRKGTFAFAD